MPSNPAACRRKKLWTPKVNKAGEATRATAFFPPLELFSYRTRSGWLPRLSPPPCSWRCKCNLPRPLSWHLLLSILNHLRSGCTYHPSQGQCCYCSRGRKKGRHVSGAHHRCSLAQPEGATNNFFFNSVAMMFQVVTLGKGAAGAQQMLHVSENIENISTAFVCLSFSSALTPVFLRRLRTTLMIKHVFFHS